MVDEGTIAAADRAARVWDAPHEGRIATGSDAHRNAFCTMLLETHNPYKPAIIDWPPLAEEACRRLKSLPIWDIAVQTEGKAKIRVLTYAQQIADPLLRRAIELDGNEEGRHKEVLSNLVAAYGIRLAEEPPYPPPRDSEWAFMMTGYSECIDSFFAFGLFAVARRSGFFPPELVDTFEPVIQEEARHILFFANWVAWQRRNLGIVRRLWLEARIFAVWVRLVLERVSLARGFDKKDESAQDNNFTLTGSKAVSDIDFSTAELFDLCLAENERRMAGYDKRLLRPTSVPRAIRFIRRFLRAKRPPAAALP